MSQIYQILWDLKILSQHLKNVATREVSGAGSKMWEDLDFFLSHFLSYPSFSPFHS